MLVFRNSAVLARKKDDALAIARFAIATYSHAASFFRGNDIPPFLVSRL
jgi:hypothetical protein